MQKTGYEVRISDVSSDVCSSDLGAGGLAGAMDPIARRLGPDAVWIAAATSEADRLALHAGAAAGLADELGYHDRTSGVSGKSVSVRVDLRGGTIHKTKIHTINNNNNRAT